MSIVVTAVFQNGVLVPDWKLDLPEGAEVVITVREITKEERQRLIAEHKRRKVPCEVLLKSDEGHGMARLDDQVEYYTLVESFLARNLAKP